MEGIKANTQKIVSSSALVSSAVVKERNSENLKLKDGNNQAQPQSSLISEQAVRVSQARASESGRKEISLKLDQIGNLVKESMSRLEEFASIVGKGELSSEDSQKLQSLSKEIGELNRNSISVTVKRPANDDDKIMQKVDTVVSMVFPPVPAFRPKEKIAASGLTAEGLATILYSAEEAKQKLASLSTQVSQAKEELSTAIASSEVIAENLAASEVIVADVDSFARKFGEKVTDIGQLFNSHSGINPELVNALVRE
jgi:hypothetical protein